MKSFSISFTGKTKAEIREALKTNAAPVQIKALIHDAMVSVEDDAVVNVSMSGWIGGTGLSISGSVHLPPPALKPEDVKSAFDLNPQIA